MSSETLLSEGRPHLRGRLSSPFRRVAEMWASPVAALLTLLLALGAAGKLGRGRRRQGGRFSTPEHYIVRRNLQAIPVSRRLRPSCAAGAATPTTGRQLRLGEQAPLREPLKPFPNIDPAAYYTPEWWARQQQPPPPPRWWEWRRWLAPWLPAAWSADALPPPAGPQRTVRVAPVLPDDGGIAAPAELRLPDSALGTELGAGGLAAAVNPQDIEDNSYFRWGAGPSPGACAPSAGAGAGGCCSVWVREAPVRASARRPPLAGVALVPCSNATASSHSPDPS